MRLDRLLEKVRQDIIGAEAWPVLFTGYRQQVSGEWREVGDRREAITAVEVETSAKEVLLVRDSEYPPLSLSRLEQELAGLIPRYGEFSVDTCEKPLLVDGEWFHVDLPVNSARRDDANQCYLLIFASQAETTR